MTKEELITALRSRGVAIKDVGLIVPQVWAGEKIKFLERFAVLVAAAAKVEEREVCAGVAFDLLNERMRQGKNPFHSAQAVRDKLRARGNK